MFFANLESHEGIEFPCLSLVLELQRGILEPGQLAGTKGKIHEGYLDAALARPLNAYHYGGQCDLIVLASYLWHGLAEAHAFNDGNKRTATVVMAVFLEMNGVTFHESVPEHEIGQFVENLCQEGCFERERLEFYLRTRCCWIEEDAS
ncbi:MAG: type II toxin-antitoxin system death-on-curing family toxin [Alphaproteobacteria bacterium]|jgi:death-on-curing family protein|nr:type II toxin-antitoxin system death-on-curing family toxin [Alphaproteobacteria bacterium]